MLFQSVNISKWHQYGHINCCIDFFSTTRENPSTTTVLCTIFEIKRPGCMWLDSSSSPSCVQVLCVPPVSSPSWVWVCCSWGDSAWQPVSFTGADTTSSSVQGSSSYQQVSHHCVFPCLWNRVSPFQRGRQLLVLLLCAGPYLHQRFSLFKKYTCFANCAEVTVFSWV